MFERPIPSLSAVTVEAFVFRAEPHHDVTRPGWRVVALVRLGDKLSLRFMVCVPVGVMNVAVPEPPAEGVLTDAGHRVHMHGPRDIVIVHGRLPSANASANKSPGSSWNPG